MSIASVERVPARDAVHFEPEDLHPAVSEADAATPDGAVETRRLFGFDFVCDGDFDHTVERIVAPQPEDGRLPLVVTPNVDHVVRLAQRRHAKLAAPLTRARIVLPDGQPIVWVSRLLRRPLAARLPGSALVPLVWRRAVEDRRRVLLIAPSLAVADGLRAEYPELATFVAPIFAADDEKAVADVVADCLSQIEAARPELVFIGVGFPKQEVLALGIIDGLSGAPGPMPLFLLLGGSFDMYLGRIRRAPGWMQDAGLEWLYRLVQEPRRLWRRYLITDLAFVLRVAAECRARLRTTEL